MNNTAPQAVSAGGVASALLVLFTILAFAIPVFILFPPVPPSKTDALRQTHQKLGFEQPRQSDAKIRPKTEEPGDSWSARVQSLWIYPVKSCKGVELSKSKVLPTGLEFDRIFTFAQLKSPFPVGVDTPAEEKDRHQWEFITQRRFPLLATVRVDLYVPDEKSAARTPEGGAAAGESFIVLRFPWQETGFRGLLQCAAAKLRDGWHAQPQIEILLPAAFPSEEEIKERGYAYEEVTIWGDKVVALNMECELPPELRLYLSVSNKLGLFRVDPGRFREVYRCAPRKAEAGYQPVTGFQDAYPLHLMNLSSVRDFESKVPKDEDLPELDERRFRANIIIDGPSAYDEETWKMIRFRMGASQGLQDPKFHISCRTVRCKMPNVNQDDGFRHPVEPDKSLRKFREVDEGAKRHGCLGMQATPLFEDTDDVEGMQTWVEIGMAVDVLARGEHVYIPR